MNRLFCLYVVALAFCPITLLANPIYQSPLQFRDLDSAIGATHSMTFNGVVEDSARLMPDIDGDGRAEWYFRSADPLDPECDILNIALSSNSFGSSFSTADLDTMMRIRRSRSRTDDGTTTERCRFITAFGVLDDLNGDGIGEITTSVNTVIFGNVQPGIIIDDQNLNSGEGFHIELGRSPTAVGDINGDGFTDIAVGIFGIANRIYAGRSQFPIFLGITITDVDQVLFESEAGSPIKPIGDINGDGFDDILFRGQNNLSQYPSIVYGDIDMPGPPATLGEFNLNTVGECISRICTIGPAGDFDNDGYDDLIVSARERFEADAESAIVYGASTGFPAGETIVSIPASRKTMLFSAGGTNVFNRVDKSRLLNDFNGDNHPEVLIEFNHRDVVLFSTPGKRPSTLSLDTVDGSDGIFIESSNISVGDINYFIDDVDDDGLPDLSFYRFHLNGLDFSDPPTPLLDSVLRQSPGNIRLYWQSVENAKSYRISSDGRVIDTLPFNIFFILMDDPTNGDGGLITIDALDSAGNLLASVSRRIRPIEDNPYNLRVDVYGENLVELFYEGVDNRYLVLRDGEILFRDVYKRSYLDDTVEAGTAYRYSIVPDLRPNESDNLDVLDLYPNYQRTSAAVTITTPGDATGLDQAPSPPTNLTGTVYSDSALEITWTRSTGTKIITGYTIHRNGEPVATTVGNSYFDFNLSPGTDYIYSVTAMDILGFDSDPSSPITLRTNGDLDNETVTVPTGLRVEVYSATVIELFWDRQSVAGVSYNLYQDNVLIANTNGTSFFIDHLQVDQSSTFALSAVDNDGIETERATVSVREAENAGPESPANLRAAVYGPNLVELFWDRISGPITYKVYINGELSFTTEGISQLVTLDGTTNQIEVSVSAVDFSGTESAASESITVGID